MFATRKRYLLSALVLCLLTCFVGGGVAETRRASTTSVLDERQAVEQGVRLERGRRWLNAIEHYEAALKEHPESRQIEYGLRRAKIHFGIERRYEDGSFRDRLLQLSESDALGLFDETLTTVRGQYIDPISSTSFVAHGTESLYLALVNEEFVDMHLANASVEQIREMRQILREHYWNRPVANQAEARQLVRQICELSQRKVGLSYGTVIMEYVFGGCNALDDYSSFLTPDRHGDLQDNIDGEFVGLGVEMKAEMGRGLLLVNVLSGSPAESGGIEAGDHIVSINGFECRYMTTDAAARLLRGPSGSRVRLEVASGDETRPRVAELTRRPVEVKSIPIAQMIDRASGVGYFQMTGFQKTSAAELDAVLGQFEREGVRAIIWDVRGNPGGLLTAAVDVLDRFLDHGIVVSTRGRKRDQNWTYSAHRLHTRRIPLVLLVDGNSASASEIVAGAVRDHRRGLVVGRQTFGKWSVQSIYTLANGTGLRVTTAKFYSPNGHTLGKVGLKPDVIVEEPEETSGYRRNLKTIDDILADADVQAGLKLLQRQLSSR